MATDRLKLYNGALMICGQRQLASLSENVEGRHLLDNVWNDGGIDFCLSQGQWRFAIRAQLLDYSTSITPDFGLRRAFEKSTDWILTSAVCQDEYFKVPLLQYTDEAGVLYSDLDQIYVKFVSNDTGYGGNLALWPPSFTEYVKHYFAAKIIGKLSADETRRAALLTRRTGLLDQSLENARNRDAISEPTRFLPSGSWARARGGGRSGPRSDGGNINSLIG